jgi:hypothetical protein
MVGRPVQLILVQNPLQKVSNPAIVMNVLIMMMMDTWNHRTQAIPGIATILMPT